MTTPLFDNLRQDQKVELAKRLAPELRAQRKRLDARARLAEFMRQGWHVLEPGTELVWNWHLDLICEALEEITLGTSTRLLINISPGMMKSMSVAVSWPAWVWLHDPAWRVIFASYQHDLSLRDSKRCRDLIESEWYQDLIPVDKDGKKAWSLDPDQNAAGKFANTMKGFRQATSVGGGGTGHRASCIVFDDPMNVEEYPSAERLDGVISWWNQRMSSRLNDRKTGAFVGIMQRVHDNDLAGHIIAKDKQNKDNPNWVPYRKLIIPMEFDPDDACPGDPRTERGELMFPAKFDAIAVEEQKINLGDYGFSAQYQQRPVPAGGGMFKPWNLRFWYNPTQSPPPPWVMPNRHGVLTACEHAPRPDRREFTVCAQSWDCTFKELKDSDFVAGQVWGKKGSACYLLDQIHGRFSVTDTIDAIRRMTAQYPYAMAKYVEDKANGPAVIQVLSAEIFGMIAVNPKGGKEARAWACSPMVDAGNIWLPHPTQYPWVEGLIKEMSSFPKGSYDDQVDAMTQCLLELHEQNIVHLQALCRWPR